VRRLAVFGSKYLSILQLTVTKTEAVITIEKSFGPFKDWIMDAQWLNIDEAPTQMALIFAHNYVELYDFKSTEPELLYSVQCEVRCILYSARIFGSTPETLLIASGTVFNQVQLWRPYVKNQDGDAIVHKKLTGHEGVIFGLQFNVDASQVVSVSDDRTIRVWPLNTEDERYID
jgi:WD40 repeat protein